MAWPAPGADARALPGCARGGLPGARGIKTISGERRAWRRPGRRCRRPGRRCPANGHTRLLSTSM